MESPKIEKGFYTFGDNFREIEKFADITTLDNVPDKPDSNTISPLKKINVTENILKIKEKKNNIT